VEDSDRSPATVPNKQPKAVSPAPPAAGNAKPKQRVQSLDIIIAENVILWDGRIVTWDEVVERLRKVRTKLGKPIHPNFYFTNGSKQKLDLTIRLPDLPQSASTLSIYRLELESTAITLELPPGVITVSRSFDQGNGSSIAVPAETMTLSAGQKKSLKLAPKTLEEARPN